MDDALQSRVEVLAREIAGQARTIEKSGPGGPGRLPARGSHRPERAQLTHSVPRIIRSLRCGTWNGPIAGTARGSVPGAGETRSRNHATPADAARATSATP